MKLLFASSNKNKIIEIKSLLPKGIELVSLEDIDFHDEIPETAKTIEGNATLKSQFCFKKFNLNCFADDTGLEVDSLNGEPGVYSARYAGETKNTEHNIDLLLKNLGNNTNRAAHFKTVISLIIDGVETTFTGIVNGEIRSERTGINGFGYDPIFEPEQIGRTFAEISLEEKNKISHRARAFEQLIQFLSEIKE
ncbi:MAG: non-canonical purine NTP diphosphatase [Crocinitomicaceae bacterium]